MVIIKSLDEIKKLRISNRMVASVLGTLKSIIRTGVTNSYHLNHVAERMAKEFGAVPGFKGYKGFPFSICSSPNNMVVHGFPNKKPLKNGDILSVDFGILHDGWYGDAAFTVPVGEVSDVAKKLIKTTEECLYKGIEKAVPGGRLGDISNAIQTHAENAGFSIVKGYVGHGIGRNLHEEPQVKNYGTAGEGILLKPGMVLSIEPMVNEKQCHTKKLKDGWGVVTKDGGLSAHFEHTIAIMDDGPEILSICGE